MMLNKDNFTINNIKVGEYVSQIKFGYHKMWGSDSGRNMAQSVTGSFKIFPKFTLKFREMNQQEIEKWQPIIDSQSQSVNYYDPDKKKQNVIETYTNDLEYVQENLGEIDGFEVAFISRKARK